VKIRPYNRNDVSRVLEIFNQSQTVPVTLERFLQKDMEAEKREALIRRVLETDEGVVAFSEIMKFPGSKKGTWYLGICVDTSFRKRGYGHRLFERAWQELKALQPVYIETVVWIKILKPAPGLKLGDFGFVSIVLRRFFLWKIIVWRIFQMKNGFVRGR
jgi:N-acetylglutamate synthase-like GNAT family acetyltransferase